MELAFETIKGETRFYGEMNLSTLVEKLKSKGGTIDLEIQEDNKGLTGTVLDRNPYGYYYGDLMEYQKDDEFFIPNRDSFSYKVIDSKDLYWWLKELIQKFDGKKSRELIEASRLIMKDEIKTIGELSQFINESGNEFEWETIIEIVQRNGWELLDGNYDICKSDTERISWAEQCGTVVFDI